MRSPRSLRFRPDGTFTVAQLTDIHWRNGDAADRRSRALVEHVLEAERPDLVVLTGDIVEGSETRGPVAAYREAVAPLESRGIPWASVFGNHDDEGRHSRLQLLRGLNRCTFGLTVRGPAHLTGVGNYSLRVRRSRGRGLAAALYFLDSNSYDVLGTFVGHDHVNDFQGVLHGVRLCYGRATGFSPYGLEGFLRGARLVRLREDERAFDTWLRLEDGTVVTDPPEHAPGTP